MNNGVSYLEITHLCRSKKYDKTSGQLGTIHILRHYRMSGWVKQMAIFADVQYCSYADLADVSNKVQKQVNVMYGWSQYMVNETLVSQTWSIWNLDRVHETLF